MAYQGNSPAANFQSLPAVQRFNGTGSATAFTLASVIANDQSILVSVDGVTQDSNAYSVSGTTLTFTAAPSSGTGNIFVHTISPVGSTVVPPDGSVSTVKLVDGAVTQAKVAGEAINESKLQVSNSPTNGYFLSAQSGNTGGLTWAEASAGKVLQVLSATKTDTQSFSGSNNFHAITGLSLAITPSATSSKILITSVVHAHMNDYVGGISLYKNSSQVVNHSESIGSRKNVNSSTRSGDSNVLTNVSLNYLDSPSSTSALTYQIYLYTRGGTYYVNRSGNDGDNDDHARTISTITAMEIGA